jgi:outer membrane protein TolC
MAAAVLALAPAVPAVLGAQTLRLGEAFRRADRAAYANRIAAGAARADAARADAALRGILPGLRLEGGWTRTTDPIGVFGMALRQRTVTPADFAPATLNDPAPRSDLTGGAVVEVPLFNADAWLGRAAGTRAAAAAAASARWTAERTRVDVVRAYFGAVLAAEKVATLETALRAARDHVRAADALAANGLVTRSDALLAAVKAGEVEADLAGARADVALAVAGLATLLGTPTDTSLVLPAALPDPERLAALAEAPADSAPRPRADVEAARSGLAAARADLRRAAALYLPRLNGFARYDWHDASAPFAGTSMWTVGIMASWSPFAGASEIAERRGAAGRLEAARAAEAGAVAAARLDSARRDADLAVARQRLAIAGQAVAQSAEAHRLVARRYAEGLASVVELLDAAAAETGTRLRHAAARYDLVVAIAARRHARGQSLAALETLDP